jgi:muramidase (phage lysozyme)
VTSSPYKLSGALGFRRATEQAKQMAAQGYTPDQIKAAFLSTIASGESPGYDVMYGGKKFSDFSRHPHQAQTVGNITSDVAGRYQFKGSTWDELQKKYGYKDFSQANQDAAAWQYANDIFKTKTGGSLEEALQSGDPGRINAAAQVLNKTWTSLPGGAEQGKGYGSQTFADIYNRSLAGAGGTSVHPPNATVGTPGATTPAAPATPVAATDKDKWGKAFSGAATGFADLRAPVLGAGGNAPQLPAQAPMVAAPMPFVAETQVDENRRNQLAQLMQSYWI